MINIENIKKIYNKDNVIGVDTINISIQNKGLVFVMGKSGSGKTTLLNLISGLDDCTEGSIYLNDINLTQLKENQWDNIRNKEIGIIFQNFNLIEDMTVKDNLSIPLKILGLDQSEINHEIEKVLKYVDLCGYEERKASDLSAGQRQRVAIARAIIKKPNVILADELTGNLDIENSEAVFELMEKISRNCLVIIVTHDNAAAFKYGDRIIRISEGKITEDISNHELKKISKRKHQVLIQNHSTGSCIEENLLLNSVNLNKIALSNPINNGEIELTIHITVSPEETDEETIEWTQEHVPNRMPHIDIIRNCLLNMKKRRMRLFVTVILFTFASLLCLIAGQLFFNNYYKAMSQYIDKGDVKNEIIYKTITVTEDDTSFDKNIYKGEMFYKDITNKFDKNSIISCLSEVNVEFISSNDKVKVTSTDIVIYSNVSAFDDLSLKGEYPLAYNEIVLSRECADYIGFTDSDIMKTVNIEGTDFTVTGIVDSQLSDSRFYSIVSDNYIEYIKENSNYLYFYANNIVESTAVKTYVNSCARLGNIDLEEKRDGFTLCYGRMPESENEILISIDLAIDLGYEENSAFPTEFRLPDLYSDKYYGKYNDYINMYDFLGKNIVVTGIYEDYSIGDDFSPEILIDGDIYSKIFNYYYDYFFVDSYIICLDSEDSYNQIKEIHSAGYRIESGISKYVYEFISMRSQLKGEIICILVICSIIALFMMISYIVYNVRDHAYKIGIFRALGVERRDINQMFVIETALLCIISATLSYISALFFISLINSKIQEIIVTENIRLLIPNYFVLFLIVCVITLTGILLTTLSTRRLMNNKSITLINHDIEG